MTDKDFEYSKEKTEIRTTLFRFSKSGISGTLHVDYAESEIYFLTGMIDGGKEKTTIRLAKAFLDLHESAAISEAAHICIKRLNASND